MRAFIVAIIILFAFTSTFGQGEQSPIVEKEIAYNDWTYKSVHTGENVNLRDFTKGKKLVMVVYFAPWCPNWKHDAPMLQRLYDKYKDKGLGIIAVGEYDPVAAMKTNLDALKITFPAVYESDSRSAKQKTLHYEYRQSTGDKRGWGSPWYIFLNPKAMEKTGDVLVRKTSVINGEVIEAEGEMFIRRSLGMSMKELRSAGAAIGKVEACETRSPTLAFAAP